MSEGDPVRATEKRFARILVEAGKTLGGLAAFIEVQGFEVEKVRSMYETVQEQLAEAWLLGNELVKYRQAEERLKSAENELFTSYGL